MENITMSENVGVSSKIKLLPHNQDLYDKIVEQIEKGEKSIFYSQATGLGKSFIFMKLVEDYFQEKKIMYIVPKIAIWENIIRYPEFKTLNAQINMFTYQSFNTYNAGLVDEYDAVFIDECHHMLSDIQGSNIMTYCSDMNREGKYTFGFTATPYYQDKYVDEECFDVSCYGYDVYEAIDNGLLPKIKLALANINLDEVPWDLKVQYSITGTKSLLDKIIQEHTEIHRLIAYFRNKRELEARAYELSILFPNYKILKTYVGNENDDLVIDEFNNYTGNVILLSVNKLLEGVHLKNVQGVLLYRNVTEFSTYMQMYGRLCDVNAKVTPLFLDVSNALLSFRGISETKSSRYQGERKIYKKKDLFDINATDYWTVELYEFMEKMNSFHWPEEDTEKLINNYGKVTLKELLKIFPNRTKASIYYKANQLGLRIDNSWSKEEDDILISNKNLSCNQLRVLLPKRTCGAIQRRKNILGLCEKQADDWTEEELDTLRNAPNMTYSELYAALPNRTKSGINAMRYKLKIKPPKPDLPEENWTIESLNTLIENYPIMGRECFKMIKDKTINQCAYKVQTLGLKRQNKDESDLVDYIKENYSKVSNADIAKLFGVEKHKVQRLASSLGLIKNINSLQRSDNNIQEIADAYNKGGYLAVKSIPKFSHLSRDRVKYIIRNCGCVSPNRGEKFTDRDKEVMDNFIYTNPNIRPTIKVLNKSFDNRPYGSLRSAIKSRMKYLGIKKIGTEFFCSNCNKHTHECICDNRPKGLSIEFINSLYN
jgi:hypothetical protein